MEDNSMAPLVLGNNCDRAGVHACPVDYDKGNTKVGLMGGQGPTLGERRWNTWALPAPAELGLAGNGQMG